MDQPNDEDRINAARANQENQGRMQSPAEQFKKQNRYELLKLGCFVAAIMICSFALPDENVGCQFQSTKFDLIFFYLCIIPETTLRIIFQYFATSNESDRMQLRNFLLKGITGLLYAVYTIYVLRTYESFTPHCYDPYPSFSLAVFAVIIIFILPQAFIVACVATLAALFSPCLIYSCIIGWREESEQR